MERWKPLSSRLTKIQNPTRSVPSRKRIRVSVTPLDKSGPPVVISSFWMSNTRTEPTHPSLMRKTLAEPEVGPTVEPESNPVLESERELESKRERELESERELELESERELKLESERELELESKRERELESERERELESERELELELDSERELELDPGRPQVRLLSITDIFLLIFAQNLNSREIVRKLYRNFEVLWTVHEIFLYSC